MAGVSSLIAVLLLFVGCRPLYSTEPTPPPLIGTIEAQVRIDDHELALAAQQGFAYHPLVGVDVWAGVGASQVRPAGSPALTLRLLRGISLTMPPTIKAVWSTLAGDGQRALQTVGSDQAFAGGLFATLVLFDSSPFIYDLDAGTAPATLLFADENARAWSVVGPVDVVAGTMRFPLDRPGLWTLGLPEGP